jgi:hypothetical protein
MGPAGAGGWKAFSSASGRRLQTFVVDIVADGTYFAEVNS